MYYDYYQSARPEIDECTAKGICSINPTLSSLQEVILLHLKELSFYLIRLKDWGASNEKIKKDVFEAIAGLIINAEYTQEQFQSVIGKLHSETIQAKEIYKQMCDNNQVKANFLKTYFKYKSKQN